jgi:hypothetical protein
MIAQKFRSERHTIENGFRFEFHPDSEILASIVRMIDAERQCCQFLRFQLTIEAAADLWSSR